MSILITTSIDINAAPKDVWAVLTDFPAYGEWSTFSKVGGIPEVGTRLAMRMPGFAFKSTVTAATPQQKLEWAAWLFNDSIFEGRHTFTLTSNADGSTHLSNVETFSGALVWPVHGLFKKGESHGNGYDGFNHALKKRVEGRVQ